jgi:hypothetical protein
MTTRQVVLRLTNPKFTIDITPHRVKLALLGNQGSMFSSTSNLLNFNPPKKFSWVLEESFRAWFAICTQLATVVVAPDKHCCHVVSKFCWAVSVFGKKIVSGVNARLAPVNKWLRTRVCNQFKKAFWRRLFLYLRTIVSTDLWILFICQQRPNTLLASFFFVFCFI